MLFAGMHKLTLLDYPDKTACTLFTAGCNFACPYCQNPTLIAFDSIGAADGLRLSEEEILEFLSKRQGLLDGVCISGGEPLAQEELPEFIRRVKEMGFLIKIDTNGSYPGRLRELVNCGVIDYVAIDIKNAPDKYEETVGITGYDTSSVEESIEFLLTGAVPCEFRTTVVRELHTHDDILSIARLISGTGKYYLQRFENPQQALQPGLKAYSKQEMQELLDKVKKILPCAELRG